MRDSNGVFTDREFAGLLDLGHAVENGEYMADRLVLEITTGFVDGEPTVRGYGIDDAISYAEAVMRRDRQALG